MTAIIRESEWLAELERLSRKNDDGRTSQEWASDCGISHKKMLDRLKEAKSLGWLVIGQRTMERIDGRKQAMTVYRIVRPKGKKR